MATEIYLLFGAGVLGFLFVLGRPIPIWIYASLAFTLAVLMDLDFASKDAKSNATMSTRVGICLYFCFIYVSILSENVSTKYGSKSDFACFACMQFFLPFSFPYGRKLVPA